MTERNISCFFVKELLPLYLEDNIDSKRRGEIEIHLNTCSQCSQFYKKLISSRDALIELSKTKVSPATIEYLKQEHTFWTEFYRKMNWSKWPQSLKWGVELVFVTFVLVVTIHVFPWLKFARALKRLQPQAPVAIMKNPEVPPMGSPSSEPTPMAVAGKSGGATPQPTTELSPQTVAQIVSPEEADTEATVHNEENQGGDTAETSDSKPKKESGFVWRGTLQVDELSDELIERVTSTITELGGTKAGEVELGWHRGDQRYYHFILPEDNYEKLLSVLNSEGLVELKKERHPRVIKNGYMRIIMTVEESPE